MASIFGNFMHGVGAAREHGRQDREEEWLRREREYMTQRRGVIDEREDMGWTQGQEDRARALSRDEQEYPLRFRALEQGVEGGDLGLEMQRFQSARMPVEAQQADAMHAEQIAGQRQGRAIRGAQESRAAELHRIQKELADLGLDEQRLMAQYGQFRQQLAPAARAFAMRNDPRPIEEFWNATFGGDNPIRIEQGEDGLYQSVPVNGGEPMKIGTREDVLRTIDTFSRSPTAYLDTLHGLQFGQGGKGGRQEPAAIQEARFVASVLPRGEGESEQDHMLRAYEISQMRNMKRPEEMRIELIRGMMQDAQAMPGRQADMADIVRRVDEVMGMMYGNQSTTGYGLGAAMQGSGARGAPQQAPAEGAAPYPDGTRLRGPDGRMYEVRNGQPVPVQ